NARELADPISTAVGRLRPLSSRAITTLRLGRPIRQRQDSKPRWHVKCLPFGNNAPGQKLASVVALSRGPKKIDSPLGALAQLFHIHRCVRDTHLGGPNMMF